MKELIKQNSKYLAFIFIIIILSIVGITYAIRIGPADDIGLNITTSPIEVNLTYDTAVNGANVTSTGKMLPISDSLITGPNVTDERVVKVKFKVSGTSNNPANTIYDIVLRDANIDCELRSEDVKWRLYKNNILLSQGNLSPTFDTMKDNRLVLTNTQQDLTTTSTEYVFLLWISESCDGNIENCDTSKDQSKYLNKTLSGILKVEVSTKSKKDLVRLTGSSLSCSYNEAQIPVGRTVTYNGQSQTLVNEGTGYSLTNNTGTNAGSYTTTATLKSGYKWSDGTTGTKTITSTINKRSITIAARDQNVVYGTTIKNDASSVSVSNLIGGQTISTINVTPEITNVGSGEITASGAKIVNSSNQDVTSNYEITYTNGTINVLCLNTATEPTAQNYDYDGTEKTGAIGGEDITLRGITSATNIGEYTFYATPKPNYCWKDNTSTEKTYNWQITGTVAPTEFTINYDANGGTGAPSSQTKVAGTDLTLSTTTPTRVGYTFNGWNTKNDGTGLNYVAGGNFTDDTNVTLYAKWTPITYTVNYVIKGGNSAGSESVSYGNVIQTRVTNPTITFTATGNANGTGATVGSATTKNQTFTGWTSSTSDGLGSNAQSGSTSSTTAWTGSLTKNSYFKNLRDTAGTVTLSANWRAVSLNLPTVSKSGYDCKWYTNTSGTGTSYSSGASYTPTSNSSLNLTVYAKCTIKTYTITYNANGGTGEPASQTKTHGTTLKLSDTIPTRDGYKFLGWSTSSSATSATYTAGANYTANANATLYAVWETATPTPSVPISIYINNLFESNPGITLTNNNVMYPYATSVNLMRDRYGGDPNASTLAGNTRYYGANPNNYVYFNCSDYTNQSSSTCELWRIIGVFKDIELADGTKQDLVKIIRNDSIGNLAWDYDKNIDSSLTTYDNNWETSSLQVLLNQKYYNGDTTGTVTYYSGSDGSTSTSLNMSSIGIKNVATRNKIAEVTWNLGGWNSSSIYSDQIYNYERETTVYSDRPTTWTGKMGLMYASDYSYATDFTKCTQKLFNYSDNSECSANDWLYKYDGEYLLSIVPDGSSYVWGIDTGGFISISSFTFAPADVRPTIYLNPTESIIPGVGDGSAANPYQLVNK